MSLYTSSEYRDSFRYQKYNIGNSILAIRIIDRSLYDYWNWHWLSLRDAYEKCISLNHAVNIDISDLTIPIIEQYVDRAMHGSTKPALS